MPLACASCHGCLVPVGSRHSPIRRNAPAGHPGPTHRKSLPATPVVAKAILGPGQAGETLLRPRAWVSFGKGFECQETWFVCDNGTQAEAHRGITQTVELNQTRPEPIVAVCESKAEGVTGAADSDYSLYLDLIYADNTPLWGQMASFSTGTHDWQRRQVVVLPEKPVKQVSFYMLLRGHGRQGLVPQSGAARDPDARRGLPVRWPARHAPGPAREGFQVRDVAAGSDFVRDRARGTGAETRCDERASARVGRQDPGRYADGHHGQDRAVTLLYAVPVNALRLRWLDDPRRSTAVQPLREYVSATQFHAGANGRLSRYPLGAVASEQHGTAMGYPKQLEEIEIAMSKRAFPGILMAWTLVFSYLPGIAWAGERPSSEKAKQPAAVKQGATMCRPKRRTLPSTPDKVGEPISKYIYGQFTEHLGRCIYGGIWAEMLEDRKFFYPVDSKESPWKSIGGAKVTMGRE